MLGIERIERRRRRTPAVDIGLPVFNGERFLASAIESILAQEYRDFEVIVLDNASTDSTAEIARDFATTDERVVYFRQDANVGAARNYNDVLALAAAPLFKWATHDDVLCPQWLGRCVDALHGQPAAVLAYTRRAIIDTDGNVIGHAHRRPKRFLTADAGPGERFADFLAKTTSCIETYGVVRRPALLATRRMLPYPASDRVLLAELVLGGWFVELPEPLFLHREHAGRSVRTHPSPVAAATWANPARRRRPVLPTWRLGWEYARAIERASLVPAERARAYRGLAAWAMHRRHLFADNLIDAGRYALGEMRYRPR
jgi:glycosyltransferase involved in cell wall biosynthesis